MIYQTNTRNLFDGPAATNIGTFDITWLNIISGQQSCRGHFWGPVSQPTRSTPTFESPLIGSSAARFGYSDCSTTGKHYIRHLGSKSCCCEAKSPNISWTSTFTFHPLPPLKTAFFCYWTLPYLKHCHTTGLPLSMEPVSRWTKMGLVSRQQYVVNTILGCMLADHFFFPDF